MKMPHPRNLLSTAVLVAATGAPLSHAAVLEEIVVTAQKREQSMQDIPVAVTAMDAAAIESRRISQVTDISLFAPNVEIVDSPTNTTAATIAIRGASQINPALTWESSVGIYLDGVFIGKNLGSIFDIAELERVEVLRGPQGTLYGKNTVGGAVNLITRKPSGELSGSITGEIGNEGYMAGRLSIDTPEVAGIRGTLSYYTSDRDGFADNDPDPAVGLNPLVSPETSSDEFQDREVEALRIALQADLTEALTASYTFDYSDVEALPRFGQLTHTSPNSFLYAGGIQEPYLTDDDKRATSGSNDQSFVESSEIQGHALNIVWNGDNFSLRSITSYREMDWFDTIDIDGTQIDIFTATRDVDYESLSQELQLSGSTDQVDYVVGAYYFEEEGDVGNPISFFRAFGVPTSDNSYGLDNESVALYGQADWRPAALDNRLTVSLGLRWTEEKKEQYIVHPGIFDETTDDSFDTTSPAISLTWAVNDDINVYTRYAMGWKSGGFNGEAATTEEFLRGYKDEEVIAYEIGMKSRLLDGRLQLNGAVFYNDFDNFQLSVFEGQNASSLVVNAPGFETSGLELEAVALLTEGLMVSLAYGYLDAEYTKFPSDFDFFDKDDAGIPYSPENNLTLGVDWTIAQTNYGEWALHVDYSYLDDYVPYIDPDQNDVSQIDSRSLFNARLALTQVELGHGSLDVALWGKNLTDEDYRINTIPFGGVDQRIDPNQGSGVGFATSYFGDPRTYGLEVTYNF